MGEVEIRSLRREILSLSKRVVLLCSWFSLTTRNTSIVSESHRISKHNENSKRMGCGFWGLGWVWTGFLGREDHSLSGFVPHG